MLDCFTFYCQAEDSIRDYKVTGVQTCALPFSADPHRRGGRSDRRRRLHEQRSMRAISNRARRRRRVAVDAALVFVIVLLMKIGRASCRERRETSLNDERSRKEMTEESVATLRE